MGWIPDRTLAMADGMRGRRSPGRYSPDVSYAVHTDVYEGPVDLLLHLILKDEVDLYESPSAASSTASWPTSTPRWPPSTSS